MHVMDGDCEKTGGCLTAEGAPELGLKEKHGGELTDSGDCQDPSVEDSKSLLASEQLPVNGEHAISPKEEAAQEELLKEEESSSLGEEERPAPPESPPKNLENLVDKEEEAQLEEDIESEQLEEEPLPEKPPEDVEKEVLPESTEKTEKAESEKMEVVEKEIKEEKEEAGGGSGEEDDRQSVTSSHVSQSETERRKRSIEREGEAEVSSGSESEGGRKRIKQEGENLTPEVSQESQVGFEDERERVIRDFVEGCSRNIEEMTHSIEKLQKELTTLADLTRAKELEWNSILKLRKLKEEMLERVMRKKRQALLFENNTAEWNTEISHQRNSKSHNGNNQLMMVPIVSSSPGSSSLSSHGVSTVTPVRMPEIGRQPRRMLPHILDPGNVLREGRNGPILDVKSIIADYSLPNRSRHPENVPRRGRRVRGDVSMVSRVPTSPALISMANMALGSGASVRTAQIPPYSLERWTSFAAQDQSQNADSSRTTQGDGNGGIGFKDVLVEFAKLSQGRSAGKPPPPYPEVTLHPVTSPQSPPNSHSSLLHGILTKSTTVPSPTHRPTTFSPTLARLLTAPERPLPTHQLSQPQMQPQFRPPTSRVSITDILSSSKKSRNEITITPVAGHPGTTKSKDEVVLLDDDDDETGSGDRLVIDEGGEGGAGSDDVPQCQGCRQKSAQFVCAGCGNQWYCSRECQVTAWEEHSDVCSG